MKILLMTFLFSFSIWAEETALSNHLRQNETYDKLYTKITSSGENKNVSEASAKIQAAYEAQKKLADDPNARAKQYYQEEVDAKPCSHCPRYLDLVLKVNQIVEKTKTKDVKSANENMIELTKLKFLYYTVKSSGEGSETGCQKYSQLLPSEETDLHKGHVSLAAEEALSLPKVTSVQLHQDGGKDVHYYYRGVGEENNRIVEVWMKPDGNAVIRYYNYESGFNLPDLGSSTKIVNTNSKGDNYIDIDPEIKTKNMVLPTDVKIGTMGNKIELTDDLSLKHESNFSYNQQQANLAFEDKNGKKYIALQGTNNTDGKKVLDAVVNYDVTLDKESDLKLGTSVGNTIEKTFDKKGRGQINDTQSVKLGLTDHNNEYFTARSYFDDQGATSVGVGNKFKAGDGYLGSDAQFDRDGKKTYKLKAIDQGYISEASLNYSDNPNGSKSYGATVGVAVDKTTKLSTTYTETTNSNSSVAVNFEKKISDTTSMVLSVSEDEKHGTNVLYQFQSRF